MSTRVGVVTFPGSLDDVDALRAARLIGADAIALWHADADLHGVDAVIVPGGFSYGDYLRAGAIAARAPVMRCVIAAARGGLPVLGICNGFQVLCEAGLLPGALMRNAGLAFHCTDQYLAVERADSVWTRRYAPGQRILIPVKHAEGRYVAAERDLDALEAEGRVLFRYSSRPDMGDERSRSASRGGADRSGAGPVGGGGGSASRGGADRAGAGSVGGGGGSASRGGAERGGAGGADARSGSASRGGAERGGAGPVGGGGGSASRGGAEPERPSTSTPGTTANPNGSMRDIAGVCSADGRIAGLMPHPEHAIDTLTGPSADGLGMFASLADALGLPVPAGPLSFAAARASGGR